MSTIKKVTRNQSKLLKLNLQHFAGAGTAESSLEDIEKRLKSIEDREKEISKILSSGDKTADLESINKELDSLDQESRQLQVLKTKATIEGINNGTISTRSIATFGEGGSPIWTGETNGMKDPIKSLDNGSKILTRSQKLSDVYRNTENLSLGKYLRGAITGNWSNATKEQNEFRSLSTATASVLIPEVLSSQVIDTARNQSILFQSGVPMVAMESNNMTISRVKTDPVFGFKAEGLETTEKTMEFEPVTLKAKTVYGLVSVTMEALQSSANLEEIVRNTMAESIARTIDKACLFGSTADEPKGILTYSDINVQAETTALSNYSPFIKAVGAIRRANGDPTAWALNADTDEQLNLLADNTGNPLVIPSVVEKLNRMVSNQLPNNEGVGTNESTSIIYDPNALLIGMQSPIMVEVSREAGDAFHKGLVYLRVYAMLDIAVLRPKHITKITGLKEA